MKCVSAGLVFRRFVYVWGGWPSFASEVIITVSTGGALSLLFENRLSLTWSQVKTCLAEIGHGRALQLCVSIYNMVKHVYMYV